MTITLASIFSPFNLFRLNDPATQLPYVLYTGLCAISMEYL